MALKPREPGKRIDRTDSGRHHPVMSKGHHSPASAAKIAKCGRTTIMRALKDGSLRAHRDNEGRWRIDADALEDWSSLRRDSDQSHPDMTSATPTDTALAMSVARLEATVEGLQAQLDSVRHDRDRWFAVATAPRPSFMDRIRRSLTT